jgi:hypothetical protein
MSGIEEMLYTFTRVMRNEAVEAEKDDAGAFGLTSRDGPRRLRHACARQLYPVSRPLRCSVERWNDGSGALAGWLYRSKKQPRSLGKSDGEDRSLQSRVFGHCDGGGFGETRLPRSSPPMSGADGATV